MLDNYTDVLTVKEAQEILKINKKTLYRLIDNRVIFAKKIGKVYRIPKQSLCEYILGGRAISSSPFEYKEAIIWMK